MWLSYFVGKKHLVIPYDMKRIGAYTALTIGLLAVYYAIRLYFVHNMWANMAIGTLLIIIYLFVLTRKDFPLSAILRRK